MEIIFFHKDIQKFLEHLDDATKDLASFKKFKADTFRKRPGAKKDYDALDLEYKLIEALVRARAKNNFTQRELAQKIGVTQSALARFESGKINPTLAFVQKVTQGLGLRIIVK
jgi:DNA-binding XRE family transcriptional regulator